jgi:LCP family protein required for cell wall assembly
MGKHSAPRGSTKPQEIRNLDPASTSGETPDEAVRRQREARQQSAAVQFRKRERRRNALLGCTGVFVIMLLAASVVAASYYHSVETRIAEKARKADPNTASVLTEPPSREPGAPFWMVVMGTDLRPGELRARSDTLILAHVDPRNKKIALLFVPRDTKVKIPVHGTQKINAAANWGTSTTIATLKDFAGVPVTHYIEVDFTGFQVLVNAIGGVWVDVPKRIDDIRASPYRATKVVEKGYQRLDGAHALTFVRSRHFLEGDLDRVKDQQIFLKALFKQTMQLKNLGNLPKIVDAIISNVTTDMNVAQMLGLAADMKGMEEADFQTVTVPGTARYQGGISYFFADMAEMKEIIRKIEAGESVENHPSQLRAQAPSVKPGEVTLTIRNGAGQSGLAAEASRQLKDDGFVVREIGNAGQPVYDQTLVVFKTEDAKAALVQDSLGFGQVVQSKTVYSFTTDVLVIVGKDWTARDGSGQE